MIYFMPPSGSPLMPADIPLPCPGVNKRPNRRLAGVLLCLHQMGLHLHASGAAIHRGRCHVVQHASACEFLLLAHSHTLVAGSDFK